MKNETQNTATALREAMSAFDAGETLARLQSLDQANTDDQAAVERGQARIQSLHAEIRALDDAEREDLEAANALRDGGDVMASARSKADMTEEIAAIRRGLQQLAREANDRNLEREAIIDKLRQQLLSTVRPVVDNLASEIHATLARLLELRAEIGAVSDFANTRHAYRHRTELDAIGKCVFDTREPTLCQPLQIDAELVAAMTEHQAISRTVRGYVTREVRIY